MLATKSVESHLIDAKALATRLGIAPGTVAKWSRSGRIPSVRLSSKCVRFNPAQVLASLTSASKAGRKPSPPDAASQITP